MIKKIIFKWFLRDLFKEFGKEVEMSKEKRRRVYYRLGKLYNFKKLARTKITEISQILIDSYRLDLDGNKDNKNKRIYLAGQIATWKEILKGTEEAEKLAGTIKDEADVEEFEFDD